MTDVSHIFLTAKVAKNYAKFAIKVCLCVPCGKIFAFLAVKKIIILLFFIVLFFQCAEQKDDPICECVKKEIVEKETKKL